MKLIDMLAGTKGDPDPKDALSGVKLTAEPTIRLLEAIDAFRDGTSEPRESALLGLAALGHVSNSTVSKFVSALASAATTDDQKTREQKQREQQRLLTRAQIMKEAYDDAARVVDAAFFGCSSGYAGLIRDRSKAVVEETLAMVKELST
jgi:hypothetical protein